jgi:hypothetical protein
VSANAKYLEGVVVSSIYRLFLVVLTLCVCFTNYAKADEEGRLPLSNIRFDSGGLDNSGPIRVEVIQDSNGIVELKVSAFGRIRRVATTELTAITGRVFNLVGASYSRGYPNTGGRSIYVLLYQGFSSGAEASAVVTILESGDVRVRTIARSDRN